MTKDEILALATLIINNIDLFSDTLKNYIDSKDSELNSSIDSKITTAKEDILNQISINAEDLKALKQLLDSLDGEADGEVNLQNALLKLLDRVNKLEEDNEIIKQDLSNVNNSLNISNTNIKTNSDKLDVIGEFMSNLKDVIAKAESKFKIIGTTTTTSDTTTSDDTSTTEDNAL